MEGDSGTTSARLNRRDIVIAVGGAIGGAILSTLSSIAVENQRAANEAKQDAKRRSMEKDEQSAQQRQKALESLAGVYDDLGDRGRLAVEFSENGKVGSPDDVRLIFRHYIRVINTISIGAVSPDEIIRYYGRGRINGWGKRFIDLSNGVAPMSKRFSEYERYNFGVIGRQLISLIK